MIPPVLEQCLKEFIDPNLGVSWDRLRWLKKIDFNKGVLSLEVELGYPGDYAEKQLRADLEQYLSGFAEVKQVKLALKPLIRAHKTQAGVEAVKNVSNIIAVASGKGGVGKSTTAVNLALALKAQGARVGLLDADIYGPNQPQMLGYTGGKPEVKDKKFQPVLLHGLATMSIGFLVDAQQPTIWRGPMVSGALQQMLSDTAWPKLDYLIVDMPPGTGDIQLTLAQKVPVSGAVIVTTPQDVALADARKGLAMFKKVEIPVLGVIENMSYYHCPKCGHDDAIFGEGGGARLAEQHSLSLLGRIPLNSKIHHLCDRGEPPVLASTDLAEPYLASALNLAAKLSLQGRNYTAKFGNIKVVHDKEN